MEHRGEEVFFAAGTKGRLPIDAVHHRPRRQEFVVLGFTDREGAPREVGSLLLGYFDEEQTLHYAGNVGTGWDHRTGAALHEKLERTPPIRLKLNDPT